MMKRFFLVLTITLVVLFSSCTLDNSVKDSGKLSSITVQIINDISARSSVFPTDGADEVENADITHYLITLTPSADTQQNKIVSAYLPKTKTSFYADNIESGTVWKATVEAYVDTKGTNTGNTVTESSPSGFVRVAIAESESIQISGNDTVIPVSLNELERTELNKAGAVTVRLLLPEGIGDEAGDRDRNSFNYKYLIYKDGDISSAPSSSPYYAQADNVAFTGEGDDGSYYDLEIDNLDQGRHLIVVSIDVPSNNGNNTHISRTGAESMVLLPDFAAYGEISLRSTEALSPDLIIKDEMGETITVSLSLNGLQQDGLYKYNSGTSSITANFTNLPDDAVPSFYIDGTVVKPTSSTGGNYVLPVSGSGTHELFVLVTQSGDNTAPLSVGSVSQQFRIEFDEIGFNPIATGGSI